MASRLGLARKEERGRKRGRERVNQERGSQESIAKIPELLGEMRSGGRGEAHELEKFRVMRRVRRARRPASMDSDIYNRCS